MRQDIVNESLKERFLLQKEYLGDNKPVNQISPLVSITVATYQHVKYIKQFLDGLLMQKTNLLYEVIIGEDGSVDGTQEICKEYAEKYPDKIRLYIRDRRLSQFVAENGKVTRFNGIWNRMSARGKYIAWCEGDDYWTDPLKLQKQVDFLEGHPEYGLCYTKVRYYHQATKRFIKTWGGPYTCFDDLFKQNTIPTLTVLLRRNLYNQYITEIQPEQQHWKMGDYPMWLWFAHESSIKLIPDVTGVYRVLANSASHSKSFNEHAQFILSTYDIRLFYANKYRMEDCPLLFKERIWWELIIAILVNRKDIVYEKMQEIKGKEMSFRQSIILSLCAKNIVLTRYLICFYMKYFIMK